MANTLTGLYPIMYNAMNVVSRELSGFIGAVSRDATAEMAAVGQSVRSPVVPAMTAEDIAPTNIAATGADQNINYVDIEITKQRKVTFHLTGEEQRGLGQNISTITQQRFAQAFRTLMNEVESDLAAEYVNASRAYGTAATTPFGTGDDLTDLSEALRILDDNGAPKADRHIVLGSAAVAKLIGKQPSLFRVNEAGDAMTRRFGELMPMFGAEFHHSGQTKTHVAGGDANYLVNNGAGYAVGDTAITVDGGAAGVVAGDVISFAGDDNQYLISADAAGAATELVLANPGLRLPVDDDDAISFQDSYVANVVLTRDAMQLAARSPAVPAEGDQADDRAYITDPMSGLVFEVSVYRQYRQVTYEVAIVWGVKTVKPEHMALLLG